jgi:hypothetical protein
MTNAAAPAWLRTGRAPLHGKVREVPVRRFVRTRWLLRQICTQVTTVCLGQYLGTATFDHTLRGANRLESPSW